MATNLTLDDRLVNEAVKLGDHKTQRAAVTAAIKEYIKAKKRFTVIEMFGTVDYDLGWDYKEARRRGNKRIPRGEPRARIP